jgi:hypothetical protein
MACCGSKEWREMTTAAQVWNEVRYDIRIWPGGRPIDEDYEPHTFAPTTFAILAAEFADQPRIAALQQ